tara:strand:- start:366 stop:692 length:327 start_codon:yes stop_codon:yes gene_type:complete
MDRRFTPNKYAGQPQWLEAVKRFLMSEFDRDPDAYFTGRQILEQATMIGNKSSANTGKPLYRMRNSPYAHKVSHYLGSRVDWVSKKKVSVSRLTGSSVTQQTAFRWKP